MTDQELDPSGFVVYSCCKGYASRGHAPDCATNSSMTDRELDALVAEKVMGLMVHGFAPVAHYDGEATVFAPGHGWDDHEKHPVVVRPTADPEMDVLGDQGEFPEQHFNGRWTGNLMECPRYSSTGDGMLAVIEKMTDERGLNFYAAKGHLPGNLLWYAEFYDDEVEDSFAPGIESTGATSLPRAVSLAALKALGVEV